MISPKSSVLVSVLSGMGLLALVSIAPVEEQFDSTAPFENIQWELQEADKSPGKSEMLARRPKKDNLVTFNLTSPSYTSSRLKNSSSWDFPFRESIASSFSKNNSNLDLFGDKADLQGLYAERDNIQIKGQFLSGTLPVSPLGQFNNRESSLSEKNNDRFGANRRLESYEVSVPLAANVGAVLVGANSELGGDRFREQRNLAMAGVSIRTGDFFQARVLTGDLTTSGSPQALLNNTPLSFNRTNQDMARREDIQRLYEWQATFVPSDFVKVQTSIYNQRNETTFASSNPDGGKVSLFFGGQQVQINLRYNYLANRREIGTFTANSFNPSQDLASLGFILFLDKSQNYSVYVGNSFYNVLNDPINRVRDGSGRSPSTFTASFRGKTRESTSFFMNFQNQFYMDGMIPGLPGGMALQALQFRGQGRSFYEFATALGLEVTF